MLTFSRKTCVICDGPLPPAIRSRTCDNPACRLSFQRHLQQGGPTCLACGRPLPAHAVSHGARTCGELECRLIDQRNAAVPAERRCQFCRVPLMSPRSSGACDDRDCQILLAFARAAERAKQARERFQQQTQMAERLRDQLAEVEGVADPRTYRVAVIQHFRGPLAPLPPDRREEFRAYLTALVDDSPGVFVESTSFHMKRTDSAAESLTSAGSPETDVPLTERPIEAGSVSSDSSRETGDVESVSSNSTPETEAPLACCSLDRHSTAEATQRPQGIWPDVGPAGERLTAGVCGYCQGYCCQQGGTHAFLSVETIQGFLQARPDVQASQVVEAYLNCLPELSYEGSCVFHSRTGCALPHEMRAATCGLYYCWGQQELRAALERGAPRRAFVAVMKDGEIAESRFLDEDPPQPQVPAPDR